MILIHKETAEIFELVLKSIDFTNGDAFTTMSCLNISYMLNNPNQLIVNTCMSGVNADNISEKFEILGLI